MKLATAPASAESQGAAGPPWRTGGADRRPSMRVIAALWAVIVLAAIAGAAMTIVVRDDLAAGDLAKVLSHVVAAAAYATLGALIVRRAGNVIGWIMLGEGAALAFLALASTYAVIGITTFPGALPAAKQVGTLAECSFAAATFTTGFMFLLFPTGTLLSRRWRPVAAAGFVLAGLTLTGLVVTPRLLQLPAPGGVSLVYPNPLGVENLKPVLRAVPVGTLNGLTVAYGALLAAAFVSLAVRYRAGGRLLRQQVKWLALAAAVFAVCLFTALLGIVAGQPWLTTVAYTAAALIALFGIPAAMTIAILKHRLYDIDVVISRAVVYGLLSAAFTAIYAGIVLGIGTFVGRRGGPVLTIAAAVTIALLFQPLRRRAQLFANRLVYGRRATPYQALSDFAGDMAGQLDLTEAVDRMVSVLAGATGADRAEAWIRVGTQLRPAAIWPHGSPPSTAVALGPDGGLPAFAGASRAVAVQHGGELLGALSLQKPRNEPLTSTEDELLRHLASQAGLVLRNAALTAELQATIDDLRASRRRLVQAQDTERQRIERNLHDGAQQQLVALTVQLSLLEEAPAIPARSGSWRADCVPGCMRPWMTCVPWPGGSTRRCWPTRDWPPPYARRPARPRFPSRSRPMASAATRGRPRPLRTSASSRRCRTLRSTRGPPGPPSPWPARTGSSGSPSPTTATASTPRSPPTAPACRAWPTGWPPPAAPSASALRPGRAPPSAAPCPWPSQ